MREADIIAKQPTSRLRTEDHNRPPAAIAKQQGLGEKTTRTKLSLGHSTQHTENGKCKLEGPEK